MFSLHTSEFLASDDSSNMVSLKAMIGWEVPMGVRNGEAIGQDASRPPALRSDQGHWSPVPVNSKKESKNWCRKSWLILDQKNTILLSIQNFPQKMMDAECGMLKTDVSKRINSMKLCGRLAGCCCGMFREIWHDKGLGPGWFESCGFFHRSKCFCTEHNLELVADEMSK